MTLLAIILAFVCSDNCYLIVHTDSDEQVTALCAAPIFEPWIEAGEMPRRYVGQRASVTIGEGEQLDGNGNAVRPFPAFVRIEIEIRHARVTVDIKVTASHGFAAASNPAIVRDGRKNPAAWAGFEFFRKGAALPQS